jgi:hypothetical protein
MKPNILLICAIALTQITPMNADEKIEKHPTRTDVAGVDGEDKEMLEAQKKAQLIILNADNKSKDLF